MARLDDAVREVRLEARLEDQRCGVARLPEARDRAAAVHEVAAGGARPIPGRREVRVGADAMVGSAAQHLLHRLVIGPDPRRAQQQRLESRLDLEGQVGRVLGRAVHELSVHQHGSHVSLADPVLGVGADEVRGRAPDEGDVLVEDARVEAAQGRGRIAQAPGGRAQAHVGDEEADVRVLAGVRQVVGRVEELDLVAGPVAAQQRLRVVPGRSGRSEAQALVQQAAELPGDLPGCLRRGRGRGKDGVASLGQRGFRCGLARDSMRKSGPREAR